jgi:hypothetical protein
MDRLSYGEVRLYQGELIRCQSYHGDYVCTCGSVAMSDDDWTESSTQVPVVRCMWVPVATSCVPDIKCLCFLRT